MSALIKIPTLVGGVSRAAQSQRPSHVVQEADNVSLSLARGAEKRAGTVFIEGVDTDDGSLDATSPTANKHVGWIDRDSDERFVYIVTPSLAASNDAMVEIFALDGEKQVVNYEASDPRTYLKAGSGDPRRRLRSLTIADATFFLNKTVITDLKGAAITYVANATNLRNQNNANNVPSWADFAHPPSGTVGAGVTTSDNLWYAREDDVGHPQGFYAAISTTAPPWYERRRTEGADSLIDETTFPCRMDFDGTDFHLSAITWVDRLSGDSALNPGPTFIGGTLSDLAFHQGRLFLAGGERIVGSQAGDLFNLWQDSSILQVDSDPIDGRIGNNKVSNITHLTSFRDSLVMTTTGSRQYELRADGPLTPSTARLEPTTSFRNVRYIQPVTLGDQLYFAGERNFANTIYEYFLSQNTVTNTAIDITSTVENYIPAEISLIEACESHDLLFILTDAEPNNLYVYKSTYDGDQKVLSSWFRWTTDEDNEILSIKVFDEELYLLILRDEKLWLEKISIEQPEEDAISTLTMQYAVRLDRKLLSQGVYDEDENTTTWTLPFEDATMTNIVLGPEWDVDEGDEEQRLKSHRLTPEVEVTAGETILTVTGQFATNLAGDPAQVYVGRPYTMLLRLSQQYVRAQDNTIAMGNTHLLFGTINHKDTGYYSIEVTPEGRQTFIHEFIFPRVGSTPLDSEFLDENGEFKFRVLAPAHAVTIDIKNDSPMPSNIVDIEFNARFVPQRGSPTK